MEENNQEQEKMQGAPLANETNNVIQEENAIPKFTPLGQVNEPAPKKKKGKAGVIIFILLLLVAIIGGLAFYYFQVYTNPKVIYQKILESGINSLTKTEEDMTTTKLKGKLDLDVDLDESYMEDGVEEVLDLINNIDATVEMQMDTNEKKAVVKLSSNYENEALLNFDMLFDTQKEGAYVKIEQFFDKVLEVEMEEGYFEELEDALESENLTLGQKVNKTKAVKILNIEFAKMIKNEYCSKEKEKITVNSKEINADKYILKMTMEEFANEIVTAIESLKNNEEFINCFEADADIKGQLEDLLEQIREIETEEDAILYVKLYKTGLKQEFVRVDFEIEAEGEKLVLKVEKTEDLYNYELSFAEETYCTGTVKTEKLDENTTKLNLTLEVDEVVTIGINFEYSSIINETIDTFDTTNAVNMEELSDTDMLKLYTNLQSSKLYELIEEFSSLSYGDILNNDTQVQVPNITDNEPINDTENNISLNAALTKRGNLVVFAQNNNSVPVDIDFEVEFYDANGLILGTSSDYLMAVAEGKEVALEMWDTPTNFATYKIFADVEVSDETEYFDEIETTHNNNGESIVVQVKNNSEDTIDYITISVVYYNQGKVVGIADGIESEIKPGRAGNFNVEFPYDSEYEDVEFDDYKVFVTEAYSYNW